MTLRRLLWVTPSLMVLILWSAPALAGPKLDLSPYLGVVPSPGDFKVFDRSDGGQRIKTVASVSIWNKGWRILTEQSVTGDSPSTGWFESFVIPGKQLYAGHESYDFGDMTLGIVLKKPAKSLRLTGSIGKAQRLKWRGAMWINGSEAGKAARMGSWNADGFEPVDTPVASYPAALRASSVSGLGLSDGVTELVYIWEETLWYVEGIGLVRGSIHSESYENGTLVEVQNWEEWLTGGSLGGVPLSAGSSSARHFSVGAGSPEAAPRMAVSHPTLSIGW